MTTGRPLYLAYMLRLWQVEGEGESFWRASLESPHTGERHGFASLETLFAFLEQHTHGVESQEQPIDNHAVDHSSQGCKLM
jgi:hypothetical protein